ncbi:MAG: RluA family pseudouridine synthase [Phycisphaerales bacterium]|nr:RluA family pseudouridine synthase [Phycisphaerales bacterium]
MPAGPTRPGPGGAHDDWRGLIRPGGKVDPAALRSRAAEQRGPDAESQPLSESDPEPDGDAEPGLVRVRFEISRDLDKRLDKYLTDRITFMSRSQLQRLIDEGAVWVNGRACKASTKVKSGDVIEVEVPPPPPKDIQPEPIPLDILFEDRWLIVVNKGPDLIVHPARSHHKGTLLNALVHHFQQQGGGGKLSEVGGDLARPGVVHRLDRHTSGVMVVAKDEEAHWQLGRQFEARTVDKRYLALVEGVIESDADIIDAPIGPHPSKAKGMREKQVVRHDELGKPALTIYRVRERFSIDRQPSPGLPPPSPAGWAPGGTHSMPTPPPARGFTLVELELKTGRTHQIRVHLSHLGYPIVGDDMYGGRPLLPAHLTAGPGGLPADAGGEPIIARQALHATILGFAHPVGGQPMRFQAGLAPDFRAAIIALRAVARSSGVRNIPGATVDVESVLAAVR